MKIVLSNPYSSRSSSCSFSSNEFFQLIENETTINGSILACIVNSISSISYFCVNSLSVNIPDTEMNEEVSTEENNSRVNTKEWI